jgi:hypothetical protein
VVRRAFERMLRHVAAGELVVETAVHPLIAGGDAWAAQRATPPGKVVLRLV